MGFTLELPMDIIKDMDFIRLRSEDIFMAMTQAGAQVVYKNVISNMSRSFAEPQKLTPYLKVTKPYKTYAGKFINTKVAFYGYYKQGQRTHVVKRGATEGQEYRSGKGYKIRRVSGRSSAEYMYDGVPVALIAIAREYGTSSGEAKKPFFRKSFRKDEIEQAMLKAQKEASGGLLE